MKISSLLSLLEDQQVHSGESLAESLGVSRTAVWKQIRKAQADGVEIRTIKGQGYQLLSKLDLLSHEAIVSGLADGMENRIDLAVLPEVGSTNREVADRLLRADGRIPVVLADSQTAGRGRRGRDWTSPKGQNLYLSLGLTLEGGFSALDGLSLALGVAVANAIEANGVSGVGLKWPNDLYANDRKFGGILVEIHGELQEGQVQVIAGVGINVHMTNVESVDQPWTSLALQWPDAAWERNRLAAAMISEMVATAAQFEKSGFRIFQEAWQKRDIFQGRYLRARGGSLEGKGAGIDAYGNYQLDAPDERVSVRAGDISLRADS